MATYGQNWKYISLNTHVQYIKDFKFWVLTVNPHRIPFPPPGGRDSEIFVGDVFTFVRDFSRCNSRNKRLIQQQLSWYYWDITMNLMTGRQERENKNRTPDSHMSRWQGSWEHQDPSGARKTLKYQMHQRQWIWKWNVFSVTRKDPMSSNTLKQKERI